MLSLVHLPSFSVIGKEGSTKDGPDFIASLIKAARASFSEVASLGSLDDNGKYLGFWGLMSDFSHSFKPWEKQFTEGLYLYGIQCPKEAKAPKDWVKWSAPERDYYVKEVTPKTYKDDFSRAVYFEIPFEGYRLVGAAFDFQDPVTEKNYLYFPVEAHPLEAKAGDLTSRIAPCGCHCSYCFFDECGGCGSDKDFCSLAAFQKDHECPNLVCSKKKGFKGCYDCPDLKGCHLGLFAGEGGNARAQCLFIQKHGKKNFERAIKSLLGKEKPYYQLMSDEGPDEKQVELLERAIEK